MAFPIFIVFLSFSPIIRTDFAGNYIVFLMQAAASTPYCFRSLKHSKTKAESCIVKCGPAFLNDCDSNLSAGKAGGAVSSSTQAPFILTVTASAGTAILFNIPFS